INQAATTCGVTASTNPAMVGVPITFTVDIFVSAPGSGAPGGSVTLYDGANLLGAAIVKAGQAVFESLKLSSGSHAIQATYHGDANFSGSSSSTLTLTVNGLSPT